VYSGVIHPLAEKNVEEALDWYEDQRRGLGLEMLSEFDLAIEFLKESPFSFPVRYSNKRICKVGKRFPYFIHYSIIENMVLIKAVFHGKRDPKKWVKRSKQG